MLSFLLLQLWPSVRSVKGYHLTVHTVITVLKHREGPEEGKLWTHSTYFKLFMFTSICSHIMGTLLGTVTNCVIIGC